MDVDAGAGNSEAIARGRRLSGSPAGALRAVADSLPTGVSNWIDHWHRVSTNQRRSAAHTRFGDFWPRGDAPTGQAQRTAVASPLPRGGTPLLDRCAVGDARDGTPSRACRCVCGAVST